MAKYLRYRGEFLSLSGVTWRAEIWQEADRAFSSVGALEFDADEPLTIEWGTKAKEDVLCGATATLKIVSPGDRTFVDLYSIEIGRVRLDVYRNNTLYWSGCIDTEFYEEPYEQLNGYVVTLTFTDFGLFERLKYQLSGMQTLENIVAYGIDRSCILCGGIEDGLISTYVDDSILRLSSIKVRSDNFYDEDGEAMTLAEVIKGILQPLALKIIQRNGKIYVYDINALYRSGTQKSIAWDGSSQMMSVDRVYNNAKVTWSPYAQGGNLLPDVCWSEDIETPPTETALNDIDGKTLGDATYYSYYYATRVRDWVGTESGFTLWTSREGDGVELVNSNARYFRIVPQYDGSESEGIAIKWPSITGYYVMTDPNTPGFEVYYDFQCETHGIDIVGQYPAALNLAFKTTPIWIPPIIDRSALLLKLRMESLIDVRFNPFETASVVLANVPAANEKEHSELLKKYGNFVYIPVRVCFQPDGTNDIYVWNNQSVISEDVSNPLTYISMGSWEKNSNTHGYISYYADDRANDCGVMGWQPNRHAINPHTEELSMPLSKADGQYLPYPLNGGGKLWVEVYGSGWQIIDAGTNITNSVNGKKQLHNLIKWALLKLPEIELVYNQPFGDDIESEDVEYQAELNSEAKEELSLNTICGTSAAGEITARGSYYTAGLAHDVQIKTFTRAGRTTQVEDLLIGTLYSQYAERRTVLSGESVILTEPIAKYSEANQGDKLFMVVGDLQNLRADTSEATYIEIRPDEYKRNNE